MAIYRCAECDKMVDNDWDPCTEDPRPNNNFDLLCPDCALEIEEQQGEQHATNN